MFNNAVAYVESRTTNKEAERAFEPKIGKRRRTKYEYGTSDKEEDALAFMDRHFRGPELIEVDPARKGVVYTKKSWRKMWEE
jgi:hypothetical protein